MNAILKQHIINNAGIYILLIIAIVFRIILVNSINQNRISPDGTGYHTIAVNIVEGNGYSNSQDAPYEKYFFREPGYPVFVAGVYKIYKGLGGSVSYIDTYNISDYSYSDPHPEITFLKYFQAIIDTLTVLFFYLSLLFFLRKKYALIITFAWALFFPQIVYVTYILREPLLLFLSMVVVYSFINYLHTKKWKWLVVLSVFWALSSLTFQFSLILGVFLFAFLFFYSKNFFFTVKSCLLAGIIMLLVSSPWLIRTYIYYPDIRIVKSFGTSLTSEYRSLINAVFTARYYSNTVDHNFEDALRGGYMDLPEKEKFRLSFSGELSNKADSINNLINEPIISKRKINNTIERALKSWFSRTPFEYGVKRTSEEIKTIFGIKFYSHLHLFFDAFLILFGLFGVFGMFLFYRKIYPLLLIFTMYISFFFIIGTEYRRLLPAQPFIVMFSVLVIMFLFDYFFHKKPLKTVKSKIFNEAECFLNFNKEDNKS